jgi:hypothetical protein
LSIRTVTQSRPAARRRRALLAAAAGPFAVLLLLLAGPLTQGLAPSLTIVRTAPYRGSALPSDLLWEEDCGKADQAKPSTFDLHSGKGGTSIAVNTKPCKAGAFRGSAPGEASVNDTLTVSVSLPRHTQGLQNLTANLTLGWKGAIQESDGTGTCPTTPSSSTTVAYYNGTGWSYPPVVSRPLVFSNATYFEYNSSFGATGNCASESELKGSVQAYLFNANSSTVVGLNGGNFAFVDAWVATTVDVDWRCGNTTLWDYGVWANSSLHCSNSNSTLTTTSDDLLTGSISNSSSLTETGSLARSMSGHTNFSASTMWFLELVFRASVHSASFGWTRGTASGYLDLAPGTTGLGWDLDSIELY